MRKIIAIVLFDLIEFCLQFRHSQGINRLGVDQVLGEFDCAVNAFECIAFIAADELIIELE